jgi:hypothetical protein
MNTSMAHVRTDLPLRINGAAVKHLSSLPQFRGIADESLIRLAKRRTGLHVRDRWVAIALILGNRIPIPVPAPDHRKQLQANAMSAPAKLAVITGGRIGR